MNKCWWCGAQVAGGVCLGPHEDYDAVKARERGQVFGPGYHVQTWPGRTPLTAEKLEVVRARVRGWRARERQRCGERRLVAG